MLERIDLIMPPTNPNGLVDYLTKQLYLALEKKGVKCRVLSAQKNNPGPFLDMLLSDPPECTLSFNGLLPDANGNFFCDMIKIPHVAYLTASPYQFVSLAQSPLNCVVCPDTPSCQFFLGLNFDNVLFVPHGVSKDAGKNPPKSKKFDVVMLASCIDFEEIRKDWKLKFPKPVFTVLESTAERSMSTPETTLVEALVAEINEQMNKQTGLDPSRLNLLELLFEIDSFIRGKDRTDLLKALKDCEIHVFGAPASAAGWDKYLKGKQFHIHNAVPYEEALKVMKQSKIVLASCPWSKNGGDERVFAALGSGAMVVTNENGYLSDNFTDGKELLFYRSDKLDDVCNKVNHYLSNPSELEQIASKGKEKALKQHTWDVRAEKLIKGLAPILEKVSER